ncbi:MAG: hypothetical protein Kow00124_09510 [Anaerolineae bacterium]
MSKLLNFMAGLLLGAFVGAVIALLFAPMPGRDLRSEAQDRADKVLSDVRAAVAEERKKLEAELEALKRGEIQLT